MSPTTASQQRFAAMVSRALAARVPLNGSIALTHRCNLRCCHCYLGDERLGAPSSGAEADASFWCNLIDQVAEAGCLFLLLTGGEPLLHPGFAAVYGRARERGLLVTVFTNATLVDSATTAMLAEQPPQLVEVTLYGASQEVFEQVSGVPGSHRRCLEGLDALATAGVRVGLKAMIMAESRHEIPAMRELARRRGLSFRLDPALFPCRDGGPSPLRYRVPPEEAVAIEMEDPALRRRSAEYYRTARHWPPDERLFTCGAGRTSFHVDPAGCLLPCLLVAGPGFDLRQGRFADGWRDVIGRFQDQTVAAGYECHRCEKRVICGLCPAEFQLETGSPFRKSEYTCQLGEARHAMLADALDEGLSGEQET